MGSCLMTRRGGGRSGFPTPGNGQLIYNTSLPEAGMSVKDYSVIASMERNGGYYVLFIQENLLLRAGGNTAFQPLVRKLADQETFGFHGYYAYDAAEKVVRSTMNSSSYFFLYK